MDEDVVEEKADAEKPKSKKKHTKIDEYFKDLRFLKVFLLVINWVLDKLISYFK